ncbi:MAG: DMT family transporter [Bacteroidetes bacterium]|nr:DMT family transporter [Bacteroidota bacterium]
MSENKKGTAVFLLILLALIWGTSFILIKQGLKVFSPAEVGSLRVAAASIFLLPFALLRWRELKQGDHLKLFLSGMMGIFIPAFLFALAQTRLQSSVTGILNTLSPIWAVVMGVLFFHQRFRGFAILGLLISFGGAIILALARADGAIGGFNGYALLVVLACALYGTNVNYLKYKVEGLGSLTVTSVSLLLIWPFALVYLFGFTDFTSKLVEQPGAWQAAGFIVILALMSTAVANLIFNKLLQISSPLFAASVTYVMPIVSVMWGVLDGEKLFLGHFIGMAAILGGVYLANRK